MCVSIDAMKTVGIYLEYSLFNAHKSISTYEYIKSIASTTINIFW